MVMAQSLFITLKNIHPDCQIDVLAPAWSLALLERMPEVSKAIVMPLAHGEFGLRARINQGRSLRAANYQQAIIWPNSWKSAITPWAAGIPVRTGYIGECRWGLLNDARKLDRKLLPMTVQRMVALGLPKTMPLPPEYPLPHLVIGPNQQAAVIHKFQLSNLKNILALCPGAEYGAAKRWPAEYYAQVARQQIANGWQVWLFGSENDRAATAQINREVDGACLDLTGRTSIAEAVDLLSLVDVVVTNDSGLMHIAAALDKKIIALFGSSDPKFTPPLHPAANVISLNMACAPCFEHECPLGHTKCLTDLKPARVTTAIAQITGADRGVAGVESACGLPQ